MSELPPELRGFMEGVREKIDRATPDVPGGTWTRTEIVALAVIQYLEGVQTILTIDDTTPGMPPGMADLLYSPDPAARDAMARMCGDVIEWIINDVDNAA